MPQSNHPAKEEACASCIYRDFYNKDGSFCAFMDYLHAPEKFNFQVSNLIEYLLENEFEDEDTISVKGKRHKTYLKTALSIIGFPDVAEVMEKNAKKAKRLLESRLDSLANWRTEETVDADGKPDSSVIVKVISDWQTRAAVFREQHLQFEVEEVKDEKREITHLNIGLQALAKGQYKKAEEILLIAASQATEHDAVEIAEALNSLAVKLIRSDGSGNSIIKLLRRAIVIRKQFLPSSDASIGIEFNNLGMYYERVGDMNKAIEYLEKAVNILDLMPQLDSQNLANPYDNLSTILFERKDFDRARSLCLKAKEARERLLGEINPLSIKSLELLADIEEAVKPHSRTAREYRKDMASRTEKLALIEETKGDPMLSTALWMSSVMGKKQGQTIIDTALNALALEVVTI